MKTNNIKKLKEELKPFWKKYSDIFDECSSKVNCLEKEMNKKVKTDIELGFFYVDGECVGIGAVDYSDRERFPLISWNELI